MIDFRYHLVSLVAVFLALAVGIVVGTATLHGPLQDRLTRDLSRTSSDNRLLEDEAAGLRAQLAASDAFAVAAGPRLLRGALPGRRVLLVTTPQTPPELVEQLTPLLQTAGAQVTGTLQLMPELSDPTQNQLVEDLVAQVVPAGAVLPDTGPVDRAAAELAVALVRPGRGPGVESQEAQAVVAAFSEAELVRFTPAADVLEPATLAVVLTGAAPAELPAAQASEQSAVLVLAAALDERSDGTVVVGPSGSAQERGPVRRLRADAAAIRQVSSVDNGDRGTGQVAAVLALAEQLAGRSGQYGADAGASAALPGPAAP